LDDLGELQHQVMNIVWEIGEASVKQVHDRSPPLCGLSPQPPCRSYVRDSSGWASPYFVFATSIRKTTLSRLPSPLILPRLAR
jgi:hypothetical protein